MEDIRQKRKVQQKQKFMKLNTQVNPPLGTKEKFNKRRIISSD